MHRKVVTTTELMKLRTDYMEPVFEGAVYPWEILPRIGSFIKALLQDPPVGFTLFKEGILVGENVTISDTATVLPPAVLGPGTEVRPGAYLRGNVITGSRCVLGNSSEFKNCVLLEHVQAPHYNYVGDSVLGNDSHMGAGSICSNLKADGKNITIHGEEGIPTSLRKIGAILGDGADIGCGSVLNPGTVIGKGTRVYPLTSVRGVIPEKSIVKSADCIVDLEER